MKRESKSEESSDFFWAYINVTMPYSSDGQLCWICQILCTIWRVLFNFFIHMYPKSFTESKKKIFCIIHTESIQNFKFLYIVIVAILQNSVFHSLAISFLTLKPFSGDLPNFHPSNFFLDCWIYGFLAIGITWCFASCHSVCWYKT